MKNGFDKWWDKIGRFFDPDTEDVPWFEKRKGLAELAFADGVKIGMARSRNYTTNRTMIQTLDDIVEELADDLGIYGSHTNEHPEGKCRCRSCWTSQFKARILRAVEVDRRLDGMSHDDK